MAQATLRDLTALQTYSFEEFELAKGAFAKTADQCVAYEEKLREIDNIILDLTKNKLEYKNDRRVERIINRLQCARNFIYKQVSKFTNFERVLKEKRDALEKLRAENKLRLEESKVAKVERAKEFDRSQRATLRKVGRPKKEGKNGK